MKPPKAMKVYLWGKRMKDIYPHATKWEVFKYKTMRFLRKLSFILIIALITSVIVFYFFPRIVEKPIEVQVESKSAVMERIAKCESGNRHFDTNGQVVLNGNKDGSVDVGRYQINSAIWGKKATELGYNLTKEDDNTSFANWLYKNYGTEPWYPSKKCWNK